MFDEVLVCLDGSSFAEKILPYARGVAASMRARLTLLRVVGKKKELGAATEYLKALARPPASDWKVKEARDAVGAILEELGQKPGALPALTTHGRGGLLESIIGSVALGLLRRAARPLLLYRPGSSAQGEAQTEVAVKSVVAALDGSEFSEKILPFATGMARALGARLELVQVLPPAGREPSIPESYRWDVLESAYLQRHSAEMRKEYGLVAEWEVLHGDPVEAIRAYMEGRYDSVLAMTSHARPPLERIILGSVAAGCVRRVGVPVLVYWPRS